MSSIDKRWEKIRREEDHETLSNLKVGQLLYDLDPRAKRLPPRADWAPYICQLKVLEIDMESGVGCWCNGGVKLLLTRHPKDCWYWAAPYEITQLWKTRPCATPEHIATALTPRAMREEEVADSDWA